MLDELKKEIAKNNAITIEMRDKYFKGLNNLQIRKFLIDNKMDSHILLYARSADVLVIIKRPNKKIKLLVQYRASEKNRIGLFGGEINASESSKMAAIRELYEETKIRATEESLKFYRQNIHDVTYLNGDKLHYISDIFTLILDDYPYIKIDDESYGAIFLDEDNYLEFIRESDNLLMMYPFFWDVIKAFIK